MERRSIPVGTANALRALGAAALLALASASWVQAGDDWLIWLDQAATADLSEQTAIRVAQSFRHSCDEGRLATYFAELGGTCFVRPWLDVGLACRQLDGRVHLRRANGLAFLGRFRG